jgi:RNA polymerase sigma factor (sigma-70 family)
VVQDAYVAALRSPPEAGRPPRPWLAQVLRNSWRASKRSDRRRQAREQTVAAQLESAEQPPNADEVLARTQLQQRIAELLTGLEEPYRATLLLRYFEERDAPAIAALYGVPAGTVRWRINEGVRRLRERLDAAYAGERGGRPRWAGLLLPLAGPQARKIPTWSPRAPVIAGGAAVGLAAAVLLLAPARSKPVNTDAATLARPTEPTSIAPNHNPKERPMTDETRRTMRTLVGVALPALVAGAAQAADPKAGDPALIAAATEGCVQMREKVYECKDAFAEAFVNQRKPPPEQRATLLARAQEEIAADGAGPLEPRRKACEATVSKFMKPGDTESLQRRLDGMKKMLAFCSAKSDCAERVECMLPFFPGGKGETAAPKR